MSDASINFRIDRHAVEQAAERGIPLSLIEQVMRDPAQSVPGDKGRTVLQGPVAWNGRQMLLRVVTATEETKGVKTLVAVTVYVTRLGRYGS